MCQTPVSVQQARETAQTMGNLAASAIHHLADALDLLSQDAAVEWRMREVRQLADAIVRLDAPTPPKGGTGPAVYVRTSRQRPDGTFETHVRSGYARGATTPEPDLSTPTPSCDAPSCGCADGTDCRANVAAEQKVIVGMDVAKDGLAISAWTLIRKDDRLVLTGGQHVTEYQLPVSLSAEEMKERLQGLIGALHFGDGPYTYPRGTRRELVNVASVLGYQDLKGGDCLWWVTPEIHQRLSEGGLVERVDDRGRIMRVASIGGTTTSSEELCIRVTPAREA